MYKSFVMNTKLADMVRAKIDASDVSDEILLRQLQNIIAEYQDRRLSKANSKTLNALFGETMTNADRQKEASAIIKTGFSAFDQLTGGFFPGELVVFGSRPAMGKTQLMVNLALQVAKRHPTLYFSYDLSPAILAARFVSSMTGIPVQKILAADLDPHEDQLINKAGEHISDLNVLINESGHHSLQVLKSQITQHCDEHSVKLVIIDYLQLINISNFRGNRDQEISYVCRELKNMAKDLGICIILVSQLNRGTESRGGTKRPLLCDLRDSGAIEEDADKVILLYRPEYYFLTEDEHGVSTKGIMDLIVAKNRNGSLGTAKLLSTEGFTSFSDYDDTYKELKISQNRLDELDIPF